jgi:hypothetical protein
MAVPISFHEITADALGNGPRYRINGHTGVVISKYTQTDEDKEEIRLDFLMPNPPPEYYHHQFIESRVLLRTDEGVEIEIFDSPQVIYELLPAAGGRRRKSRRSRRTHRKSRKSRLSRRNVTG